LAPEPSAAERRVPSRLWRGTGLQVAGRIYGSLCTFAILGVLARELAREDFGRFTFYLAAFALLDAAVDFGTGTVAVRRSAGDPWAIAPVLSAARRLRLVLGLVGFLGVGLTALVLEEPGWGWIALAALYPLTHVFELSATVFKNQLSWGRPVAVRAFAATLRLAAVLLLVSAEVRAPGPYLFATAAGSALANYLLHRLARPHLPRPTIPLQPARGLWREAWPLGLALLCQQAYFYVDNLFVRGLRGDEELAHYNAAVRVLSFGIMIAQYAALTGLPWLARRGSAGDLGGAAARLGQPLFALAGFGCGLVATWAEPLLVLLFGAPFAAAAPSLRWLTVAAALIYAGAVLLTAVVSLGRSGLVLRIAGGALLLNLLGNTWLVPRLGIEGAALATVATEAAVTVASAAVLARAAPGFTRFHPWRWGLGPLAGALGLGLGQGLRAWFG
jgi:O-antigen/teichoic acid export membrane protein